MEFWFISWKGLSNRLCIRPAPIVVFMPMLSSMLSTRKEEYLKFYLEEKEGALHAKLLGNKALDVKDFTVLTQKVYGEIKEDMLSKRENLCSGIPKKDLLSKFLASTTDKICYLLTS